MARKTIILITGPTASGKTSIAISLAKKFRTAIISADSRQCFTETNIGVAKPSAEQLSVVKHYFINSHSIHDNVNAGTFEIYALQAANEIFQHRDVAIMAGGTGLYIRAFCEGLDEVPEVSPEIRENIISSFAVKGLDWLQQQVALHDPIYYSEGEIQNPRRLMRALEVKLATGRSIKSFQQKTPLTRSFDVIKYALDIPKPQLHHNINARVDRMMEEGLLEEVKGLVPFRQLNALQTVGYTELFDHLDGKLSLQEAVEKIKINTRHYAKRQLTWLRKDRDIQWITGADQVL